MEKIWETVARGRRPRATVSQIFSTTEGQWFDCSLSSLEITFLLPNCFKSPKHCQQYTDACRSLWEIWRFVIFVTWQVNSALLTGQQFFLLPAYPEVANLSCNSQKCVILIEIEQWVIMYFTLELCISGLLAFWSYFINMKIVLLMLISSYLKSFCREQLVNHVTRQQYTVISWLCWEQSNYYPQVVENIWETVVRGWKPKITGYKIFSTTEGQ